MPPGLYVHIPFCGSICSYCNFNRGLLDEALKKRYLRAVQSEIRAVADRVNRGVHPLTGQSLGLDHRREVRPRDTRSRLAADTIYFGGGTPSLMSGEEIADLIAACRDAFAVTDEAEVTLETNPETVTIERMQAFRAAGVNRVSMGVQSFRDEELRRLGRVHDAARARDALAATRAAGIDNVSLDLMLWLPQQTVADCLYSVQSLADLSPSHASLYLLELYPNSPLKEDMARSGWSLAPDEDAAEMYLRAIDLLGASGYAQYEISNFARPGLESRHNLKYWSDGEWLAFGCGAHSTIGGVRWKNEAATEMYAACVEGGGQRLAMTGERVLTRAERFQEAVFMGLRLAAGIDTSEIARRYGVDLWQDYADRLKPFVEEGLLVLDAALGAPAVGEAPARLRLTPRGFLLSNEIFSVFIDDMVR